MDIIDIINNINIKKYLVDGEEEDFDEYYSCIKCGKHLHMVNYRLLPCNNHHNGCDDCWDKTIGDNNGKCISNTCDLIIQNKESIPKNTSDIVIRQFNRLMIHCPYSSQGKIISNVNNNNDTPPSDQDNETTCNQTISIGQLSVHLTECNGRKCKWCKSIVHTNTCKMKIIKCIGCNQDFESGEINKHYEQCTEVEVECGLCGDIVKRTELDYHLKSIADSKSHIPGIIEMAFQNREDINKLKSCIQHKDYQINRLNNTVNTLVETNNQLKDSVDELRKFGNQLKNQVDILNRLFNEDVFDKLQDLLNNNNNNNNNNSNSSSNRINNNRFNNNNNRINNNNNNNNNSSSNSYKRRYNNNNNSEDDDDGDDDDDDDDASNQDIKKFKIEENKYEVDLSEDTDEENESEYGNDDDNDDGDENSFNKIGNSNSYKGVWFIKNFTYKKDKNKGKMIKFVKIGGRQFTLFLFTSGLNRKSKNAAVYLTQKENIKFDFIVTFKNDDSTQDITRSYKYREPNFNDKSPLKKHGMENILRSDKLNEVEGWINMNKLQMEFEVKLL